jgi:lambda family phage minor tail protein L
MAVSRTYYRTSSLTASTTSSGTPAVKTRLTFSPTAGSRYLILAGCAFSNNLDNFRYSIRLLNPAGTMIRLFEARPDDPMVVGTSTQTYQDWTAALYTAPTSPGTVNFTLDYALSSDSTTQILTVSQAWIVAIKLGATDYVDEDTTSTITTSTTYTSKYSGNLPSTARNYAVIAYASINNAHSVQNFNSSARITLDGGTIGLVDPLAMSYVLAGAECPVLGLGTINATGGEAYSFDYKAGTSSDATRLNDCFLCALDLNTLPDMFQDAKYVLASTTATTFQNRLSVAFTAAGANHVLLTAATMSISSGTSGKTAEMRVQRNGTTIGATQSIGTTGGADNDTDWSFGLLSFEALTPNTAYTYTLEYRSATGGTARLPTAAMMLLQLDGATIYDSSDNESTDVSDAFGNNLNAGVSVGPESVHLADITDRTSAAVSDAGNAAVSPASTFANDMAMLGQLAESILLGSGTDAALGGGGNVSIAFAVGVGDFISYGNVADDSVQFVTSVGDSVAGGSALVAPVVFDVSIGYVTDFTFIAAATLANDVITENVGVNFGVDAQKIFPIPLSYSEIVYPADFIDVNLIVGKHIGELINDLNQEDMIFLYSIDMSIHGLGVHYFTPHVLPNGVLFNNQLYTPIPIDITGFQRTGDGSLPKPKMKVGNVARTLVEYLLINDDLISSIVTRVRTYRRNLDDGLEPDPTSMIQPIDIFLIDRKSRQDSVAIEFELTPAIDQDGRQLPARRMIRDTCLWRYRQWDGSKFVYDRVECPYTGTHYFDEKGGPVPTAAGDRCGKRLRDCRLRFGVNATLPYGGFPGAGKTSS